MSRVSVIMPAYNSAAFITQAVASILAQTLRDWELVVVDDGSTDTTAKLVQGFPDSRIRLIFHPTNRGLAAARNTGLSYASGEFIAWLDADDIASPNRLDRQVEFLSAHPGVAVCGSTVRTFGANEETWRYPRRADVSAARMLFDNPLATSSVTMRSSALSTLNSEPFREDFAPAEDYDLWERLRAQGHESVALRRVLTRYRRHSGQVTQSLARRQRDAALAVQRRQLQALGIEPTAADLAVHEAIGLNWGRSFLPDEASKARQWLLRIARANTESACYPNSGMSVVLKQRSAIVEGSIHPRGAQRVLAKWYALRS